MPASSAQTQGLTVGGRHFTSTELANLIVLSGFISTASRYCVLRTPNSTSGYQVPNGKTLYMYVVACQTSTNAIGTGQPGYGDNDVGQDTATTPTNLVSLCGFTTSVNFSVGHVNTSILAQNPGYTYMDFQVPQNKFPVMKAGQNNSSFTVYGLLV